MGPRTALRTCLICKFASFTGRASRSEFWWFFLLMMAMGTVCLLLDSLLFPRRRGPFEPFGSLASENYLLWIFTLIALVPILAAAWRRLHDSGRAAWWLLLQPVVMFGLLFLANESGPYLYGTIDGDPFDGFYQSVVSITFYAALLSPLIVPLLLSLPSQPGPNKYGPNLHEVTP